MSTRESLPARLRQATDNSELLPVVSFGEWVRRIQVLCDEAADALSPNPPIEPERDREASLYGGYAALWHSNYGPTGGR